MVAMVNLFVDALAAHLYSSHVSFTEIIDILHRRTYVMVPHFLEFGAFMGPRGENSGVPTLDPPVYHRWLKRKRNIPRCKSIKPPPSVIDRCVLKKVRDFMEHTKMT